MVESLSRYGKEGFHSNISISSNLPTNLNSYDFVFIDSVNEMGLEPDDLRKLQTKYPTISFINIFKSTKDGFVHGDLDHIVFNIAMLYAFNVHVP